MQKCTLMLIFCLKLSKHNTLSYHRLCASVSTVETMTSKVNGNMEISTPCIAETPENIETKIGVNDYVMDPYNHANFCGNRSNGGCSPYCRNITYLLLCVPFLPFFSCRCLHQQEAQLPQRNSASAAHTCAADALFLCGSCIGLGIGRYM